MNTTKTNTTTNEAVAVFQTSADLKSALLIVSLVVNLFLFTAWLVIQADPRVALVVG
ncbi:MAG TPA: hypothetical protein VF597_00160 [Candidatus Saccharimonadales bacterium]|jgi:hypothetical protein